MKVVILCGGKGLRIGEMTGEIPKPLIPIGGKPILWHIMNIYLKYGYDDFILLLGYKGDRIKEYFLNEEWRENNFTYDNRNGEKVITLLDNAKRWRITFIDTGQDTMTGSRVKRVEKYIESDTFLLTYGDGIADINIEKLVDFHMKKGKLATLTGIHGKSQYGLMHVENDLAINFVEKPMLTEKRIINGGFFVFQKEVLDYLDSTDDCILERSPLMRLSEEKQLAVYKHAGFWSSLDTYKDYIELNDDWSLISRLIYS